MRDGVASRSLEGLTRAEVYLEPQARCCAVAATGLHRNADAASEQMTQLLFGELFDVLEEEAGGFVWGQARRDGYVGFVAASALSPPMTEATHRIAALRTYAFAEPSIKAKAAGPYSMNSLVAVEAVEGRLSKVAGAGWMASAHLAPVGTFETDFVAVAEQFVGAPYLWGGRESLGLDCSGLVQAALFACGRGCPRDTDQQAAMGQAVDQPTFRRGDLVCWNGHVAIGVDADRIIHANAHHMAVAVEPLETAISRIEAAGYGRPTGFRRL